MKSDRTGRKRTRSTLCTVSLLALLLIVGIRASPVLAEDNDYPHNEVQGASCNTGTCHAAYGGGTGPDYKEGDPSCLYCHDDTDPAGSLPAPTASTHSSATTSTKYGTWSTTCIDCHHEHLQAQYWAFGEDSLFFTGTSDFGGITETALTMTGAGWEEDCFAGMVLFPNIEDPYADWNNYGIIGNTSDTITVKGPMLLADTPYDTGVGTGGKPFAILYGQGINAYVPDEPPTRPVRFFRSEGANSFADGDATYDGICEVCHTRTNHHRNDGTAPQQSHFDGARCTTCHSHANGFTADAFDHTAAGAVVPVETCMECHGTQGSDPVVDVHDNLCALCHFNTSGGGPLVEPLESTVPNGGECTACHDFGEAHGNVAHTASPGSGPVVIFADDAHDDAGWSGEPPYFDVIVDCSLCHASDLREIHGNNCATCHPTPYDTLGFWSGGCQQGGCHSSYHGDSTTAHLPYADPQAPGNDCFRCHDGSWGVPQANCLNCHSSYDPGDVTPPVTTSDVKGEYDGMAEINFTIFDNGKVSVGTTFYRLDGGSVETGSRVLVSEPGTHELEFWSEDQAGNTEATPNVVSFNIVTDTTPPTTTSNAKPSYNYGSATITLIATDDGTNGVKDTFYRINGGSTQTGTTVSIATNGTYTLTFWSEDWSGNVESEKSVTFTVASGPGTIRLVWGNSDGDPSQAPTGSDWAGWVIRKGNRFGTVVALGDSEDIPGWKGISDINVPVSNTPYYVIVYTWTEDEEDNEIWIPNVYVTTPGEVVRKSY